MTDRNLDRSPLVTEAISSPDVPYYVYLLIDPATGRPFYVGKGRGERFRSHGIEAAVLFAAGVSSAEQRRKVGRIQAINAAGQKPRIEFARIRIATEREAYLIEAALIDVLNRHGDTLLNEVRGHHTASGLVTLEDLERRYGAIEFTTQKRAILINLGRWRPDPDLEVPRKGHGFRPDMTPEELYASARAWWRIGKRNYPYAVAIHEGITRAVWVIDPTSWVSHRRPGEQVRWAFEAEPAPADVHDAFVGAIGRRVPTERADGRRVFGRQGAIAYWPE
jgi:hypothetical protein